MKFRTLSEYEKKVINDILEQKNTGCILNPNASPFPTVAYAIWEEPDGEIDFGPVRWGHKNNYVTDEGTESSLSVSPFPGGWTAVPISRIRRIRHWKAMQ